MIDIPESTKKLFLAFPLMRTRVTFRIMDPLRLPGHKGSAIRGAFGRALRKVCCPFPKLECAPCPLVATCTYMSAFGDRLPVGDSFVRGIREPPRPFVLRPPDVKRRQFDPGEELQFEMLLIGETTRKLSFYSSALEEMGQAGLGERRARLALVRFESIGPDDTALPVSFSSSPSACGAHPVRTAWDLLQTRPVPEQAVIEFTAPTCLRGPGRKYYKKIPEFRVIFRHVLRRFINLAHIHCGLDCSSLDCEGLYHQAKAITMSQDRPDSRRVWSRYSSRQKCEHPLGGVWGERELHGDLTHLWPFLVIGEQLHVGKHATFGLGRYVLHSPFLGE